MLGVFIDAGQRGYVWAILGHFQAEIGGKMARNARDLMVGLEARRQSARDASFSFAAHDVSNCGRSNTNLRQSLLEYKRGVGRRLSALEYRGGGLCVGRYITFVFMSVCKKLTLAG